MPGMQMMPHMMGHRPLFPSVIATSASQQKPTFPAYSNATISAPPTVSTSSTSTNMSDTQKPPTIPQTAGTASKIIHPPEDVSLEEIRARRQQYRANKLSASPQTSSSSTPTSAASNAKYNESKMVQAAQEVSSKLNANCNLLSFISLCLSLIDVCVWNIHKLSTFLVIFVSDLSWQIIFLRTWWTRSCIRLFSYSILIIWNAWWNIYLFFLRLHWQSEALEASLDVSYASLALLNMTISLNNFSIIFDRNSNL